METAQVTACSPPSQMGPRGGGSDPQHPRRQGCKGVHPLSSKAAPLHLFKNNRVPKRSFFPIILVDLVSDAAYVHNPVYVTRLMFIQPALQNLQRRISHNSPTQSLLATHYPYVKAVSYCPASLFLAAVKVLVFWSWSQWI